VSAVQGRRPRGGLAVPALFALMALAAFVGLGTWQIQRKAWKEALIDALEQRLSSPAIDLPPPEQWGRLDPAVDEFRRVKFSAAFLPREEALVYASGSALRSDVSGPGYWVFAPARPAAGGLIVVNRGFVPEGRQDPSTRMAGDIEGRADLIGVMRWPESAGLFSPSQDAAHNLWFVRDPVAMAISKGWGAVAPFFVELEGPQPPGGLPQAGALRANLRNEHVQYAITWYGLAIVIAVMFVFWLIGRRGSDTT
jgi:surfeit locus 1 family protein